MIVSNTLKQVNLLKYRNLSKIPSAIHKETLHPWNDENWLNKNTNIILLKDAKQMTKKYNEISNDILLIMSINGDIKAIEERLIRDIMGVENIDWLNAKNKFEEIKNYNKQFDPIIRIPYYSGITIAISAALISIPLCFDLNTVLWFNKQFVTSDIPSSKDLETPLEVGSWAWNWMEPPIGQISFFLLCMQYVRGQLQILNAKPLTEIIMEKRANRLIQKYPRYDELIMKTYSKNTNLL